MSSPSETEELEVCRLQLVHGLTKLALASSPDARLKEPPFTFDFSKKIFRLNSQCNTPSRRTIQKKGSNSLGQRCRHGQQPTLVYRPAPSSSLVRSLLYREPVGESIPKTMFYSISLKTSILRQNSCQIVKELHIPCSKRFSKQRSFTPHSLPLNT